MIWSEHYAKVIRRAGGLEVTALSEVGGKDVIRRAGGLEVTGGTEAS
ncbi:hypothetical protein DWUX_100 [Desulfovibrio diazotrophicus]|nr:hypothetical protein DWUX_100 [Desulfovibrio diazotrophicus]